MVIFFQTIGLLLFFDKNSMPCRGSESATRSRTWRTASVRLSLPYSSARCASARALSTASRRPLKKPCQLAIGLMHW